MEERLKCALQRYCEFRSGQLESLLPVVQKDAFVRLATGSGKSLCMFLAPLAISDIALEVVLLMG